MTYITRYKNTINPTIKNSKLYIEKLCIHYFYVFDLYLENNVYFYRFHNDIR